MRTSLVVPVLIFGALISNSSTAGSPLASTCTYYFQTINNPEYDSSIEIELITIPKVLQLFTTTDGMLLGILQGKTLTSELSQTLKKQFPEYRNKLSRIPWEKLNPETQRKIVAWVHQDQSFKKSRLIRGLIPKQSIKIYLETPTSIFGKQYAIGWHELPLREILGQEPLHFTSPKTMTDFSTLEMHLRQRVNPSRNLEDAWNILEALKINPVPVHQHVVGNLSPENFRPYLIIESARLIEFHRRLNLYTEMLRLLNRKPVEKIHDEKNIFFDSLKQDRLQSDFLGTFMNLASIAPDQPKQAPRRQPAYVCLRLPGTYEGTEPLFGFEFRTLTKNDPPVDQEKMKKLMDSTQYSITHQDYGLPKKKFEQWIRTELHETSNNQDILKDASDKEITQFVNVQIKNLYYSKNLNYRFLIEVLGQKKARHIYNRLSNAPFASNQAIPMLTHDWSHDPLLFGDPTTQRKIREIQKTALKRLDAGEHPSDTLIYFLKKSSFFKIIEDSLGISNEKRLGKSP